MTKKVTIAVLFIMLAVPTLWAKEQNKAKTIDMPSQAFDKDGKVICSEPWNAKEKKCYTWKIDGEVISMSGGRIPAKLVPRYKELQARFVREGLKQYGVSPTWNAKDYAKAYFNCKGRHGHCFTSNGQSTTVLADIAEERRKLLEGQPEDPDQYHFIEWRLHGGYLGSPRAYIYDNQLSERQVRRVAKHQRRFVEECFRQLLGEETDEPRLLKIALKASYAIASAMEPAKRKEHFAAWKSECGQRDEHPADATIRFLLTKQHGRGTWECPNAKSRLWAFGYPCRTIQDRHDNDLTSQLRGVVPALREAKRK